MKRLGFLLVLLLSFAALSVMYFGASMMAEDDEALLLYMRYPSGYGYYEETELRELYVRNASTGEERLLTTGFSDAGWAPDGRIWVVDDNEEYERRLRFFDAQTGEVSVFEDSLFADYCEANVFWSPNGQQFAYITGTYNDRLLHVQNLADGSSYQQVNRGDNIPIWSPDSQYLYQGTPFSTQGTLFRAEDGSTIMPIEDYIVSFSPDSLEFSYRDNFGDIHIYDFTTGEETEFLHRYGRNNWGNFLVYGRYVFWDASPSSEILSYYDMQEQRFYRIDLAFPARFAEWIEDENRILLYTDFVQSPIETRPRHRKLLSYDMASGEIQTILETAGWIERVYRNGQWLAVRYNPTRPEEVERTTTRLMITNGETVHHFELTIRGDWWSFSPKITNHETDFLIHAESGLYRFDTQTGLLETLYSDYAGSPFVSPDENHIAFWHYNNGAYHDLRILNRDGTYSLSEADNFVWILGWQGGTRQALLSRSYCGYG